MWHTLLTSMWIAWIFKRSQGDSAVLEIGPRVATLLRSVLSDRGQPYESPHITGR